MTHPVDTHIQTTTSKATTAQVWISNGLMVHILVDPSDPKAVTVTVIGPTPRHPDDVTVGSTELWPGSNAQVSHRFYLV